MTEELQLKISALPDSPGCYLMKSRGEIIYVGKAKNLKNRVRQYFHPSKSHTPKVQAMVEKGQLTQSEAKNHPRKHFITRALGVEDTVACDYTELIFPEKGVLLICTDGLTNMVEPDDIYKAVNSTSEENIPDVLIHAANMAGGSDNITVVVLADDPQ